MNAINNRTAEEIEEQVGNLRLLMFLVIIPGLSLLPALLVFCQSRLRRFCSHVADTDTGGALPVGAGASLAAAESSAVLLRARVSGVILQVGWTCCVLGFVPMFWNFGAPTQEAMGMRADPSGSFTHFIGVAFVGVAVLFLALRPTDAWKIAAGCRLFLVFNALLGPANLFLFLSTLGARQDAVALVGSLGFLVYFFVAAAIVALLVPAVFAWRGGSCARSSMPPRRQLRRLWLTMRLTLFGIALIFFIGPTPRVVRDGLALGDQGFFLSATISLLAALALTSDVRGAVHRWLGALGKRGSEQQEAAAVASLIGGKTSGGALTLAQERFRALPVASLAEEELADNKPNPALARKAEAAALGEVTAFMSHSWSDDAAAKYARLLEYNAEHSRDAPGEPCRVWLDKACIDQDDIDASLACLPVFLSGCRDLLVLAGRTYTTRLWCVMEMFVFLRMGGRRERIVIKLLEEGDDLPRMLATFDAGKARCFADGDRHKLWAVIEAAFGTFAPFNRLVRGISADRLAADTRRNAASSRNPVKRKAVAV